MGLKGLDSPCLAMSRLLGFANRTAEDIEYFKAACAAASAASAASAPGNHGAALAIVQASSGNFQDSLATHSPSAVTFALIHKSRP